MNYSKKISIKNEWKDYIKFIKKLVSPMELLVFSKNYLNLLGYPYKDIKNLPECVKGSVKLFNKFSLDIFG